MQKALKYGIPDALGISCYECGFADRMIAQALRDVLITAGYSGLSFFPAVNQHREELRTRLANFPSYFETVLNTIQ